MTQPPADLDSPWKDMQTFEEDRKVTYVTNAERFGFERGIRQGRQEGLEQGLEQGLENERSLIIRLLSRKIGDIPELLIAQIQQLTFTELESLGEALLDFSQPSDLETWLQRLKAGL